jgi:hypothetical protein
LKKSDLKIILGLAFALPSTILGVFGTAYWLVTKKIISEKVALILLVAVTVNTFYLMIRYGLAKKKRKH